jgi:uncharacterized protein YjiS (DUF1127 family)
MPAITSLAIQAGAPVIRALTALGARAGQGLKRLRKRMQNRRDAMQLASFDERMLADLGLTRGDVRDAYAEPLWRDPTDVLARRAAERRCNRRGSAARSLASPELCYPPIGRPARYLV